MGQKGETPELTLQQFYEDAPLYQECYISDLSDYETNAKIRKLQNLSSGNVGVPKKTYRPYPKRINIYCRTCGGKYMFSAYANTPSHTNVNKNTVVNMSEFYQTGMTCMSCQEENIILYFKLDDKGYATKSGPTPFSRTFC